MDNRIGDNLRILRKKAGLSLRALEKEVGLSHNTLGAYERHSIEPTITNCYRLCRYFGVPVEYLFLGEACLRNYQDHELSVLAGRIDSFNEEHRQTVKKYLGKYIHTVEELAGLQQEAE